MCNPGAFNCVICKQWTVCIMRCRKWCQVFDGVRDDVVVAEDDAQVCQTCFEAHEHRDNATPYACYGISEEVEDLVTVFDEGLTLRESESFKRACEASFHEYKAFRTILDSWASSNKLSETRFDDLMISISLTCLKGGIPGATKRFFRDRLGSERTGAASPLDQTDRTKLVAKKRTHNTRLTQEEDCVVELSKSLSQGRAVFTFGEPTYMEEYESQPMPESGISLAFQGLTIRTPDAMIFGGHDAASFNRHRPIKPLPRGRRHRAAKL